MGNVKNERANAFRAASDTSGALKLNPTEIQYFYNAEVIPRTRILNANRFPFAFKILEYLGYLTVVCQ